jgi:hypothetical protein
MVRMYAKGLASLQSFIFASLYDPAYDDVPYEFPGHKNKITSMLTAHKFQIP